MDNKRYKDTLLLPKTSLPLKNFHPTETEKKIFELWETKQVYQKVRNTLRFILGNLTNLPPEIKNEKDLEKNLNLVDYYVLHQLEKLVKESENNYTKYNFTPIYFLC